MGLVTPLLSPLYLLATVAGQVAPTAPAPAPQNQAPTQPEPPRKEEKTPVENIEGRRRPGFNHPLPDAVTQNNIGAVRPPPPEAFPTDQIPIPDRWRLIQTLGIVKERWFDPYSQNTLKGDRP